MTKEETFLIKLHALSLKKGSPHLEIDRYEIGRALGYNDRSVNNMVQTLAQTNFLKRGEDNNVFLTEHGLKLVNLLLCTK
jgi:Mn-dependent DtxR family transcriptional regulator